uniref:flagellar biosynthetic protein FliO n=1 Tax=Agathobacter sp. TaxID=2021311 RepID=UPI004056C5D0
MYNILLSSSLERFVELIGVVFIFIFVLVITYIATRWIAGYQKQQMKNGNLHIIETISAGTNKTICLVRAGTEYLVIGIGKDEIHPLATLTEEQLTNLQFKEEYQNSEMANESFQGILEKMKEKLPKK